jgi:hypothetical protein
LSGADELSWEQGDLLNKELRKYPVPTRSLGDHMKKGKDEMSKICRAHIGK